MTHTSVTERDSHSSQERDFFSSSKNIRTTHTSTTERDFSSSSKNIRMTHTSVTERETVIHRREHSAMTSLSLQLYLAIFISSGSNAMALRSEASPFLLSFLFSRFSSRRICFCSCRSSSDWQSDKNHYQQIPSPRDETVAMEVGLMVTAIMEISTAPTFRKHGALYNEQCNTKPGEKINL